VMPANFDLSSAPATLAPAAPLRTEAPAPAKLPPTAFQSAP
jgi:hypothetical protein